MSSPLNEHALKHLAELARLELQPDEEKKILLDLEKILDHFSELQSVPTEHVEPMAGGTALTNVFREDEARVSTNLGNGRKQFPETENGFLKIPPVFGNE